MRRCRAEMCDANDESRRPAVGFAQRYDDLDAATCARYSRQLLLPEIGAAGQHKLLNASALVIGAGGLGCPLCQYLAASGVGTIGVVDGDTVDASNLHRQVAHREIDAKNGVNKAESMKRFITQLNSSVKCIAYPHHLDTTNALALARRYDIVVDCTDNPATRYLVNYAAVRCGKPLVSAAALKWEGQFAVYNYGSACPCYRCVFPRYSRPGGDTRCDAAGVFGPVVGMVGMMQALHAVKILAGAMPAVQHGQSVLHLFDGMSCEWRRVKLIGRRPDCPDCSQPLVEEGGDLAISANDPFVKFWRHVTEAQTCQAVSLLQPSERIQPVTLAEKLGEKSNSQCLLIDVRAESEYDIGHLTDSINIPMNLWMSRKNCDVVNGEMGERRPPYFGRLHEALNDRNGDTDNVVFICRRGNDSQIAAKRLMDDLADSNVAIQLSDIKSPVKICDLTGGLVAWNRCVDNTFPVY